MAHRGHRDSDLAHRAHWDSDLAHRGSSGLRFGSLGVLRTEIMFIGGHRARRDSYLAHWGSSGLRLGSSGVIRTQICQIFVRFNLVGFSGWEDGDFPFICML